MICFICNIRPVVESPVRTKSGKIRYKKRCQQCIAESRAIRINGNRDYVVSFKKAFCESCGFIAKNTCQLDVDHIDGNRYNRDPSNFQTLCSNCHRLKTSEERDNLKWMAKTAEEARQCFLPL